MRRLIFIIIISVAAVLKLNAQDIDIADQQVKFKTNKFYSLYMFAQGLVGSPAASPTIKMAFDLSEHVKNKDLIRAITRIKNINTFYSYTFKGYPEYRNYNVQLWQLLKVAAANSANINEFKLGIAGMLPVNDINSITESLINLQDLHEELLWKPYEEALETYIEELTREASKGDFNKVFEKAINFYGTNWNNNLPMIVNVLPLPEVEKNIIEIASPDGNVLTYSVHIREGRDIAEDLGVVFHELDHILYKNQPVDLQNKLEKYFLNHQSPYKVIGYRVLDESLATALGQGFYYQYITGKADEGNWYDVPQVNKVAKSIFPLVAEYLHKDRTIDSLFIDRYLEVYEDDFPEDLTDIRSNISNINILMSEAYSDQNKVFAPFFSNFAMRSINDEKGVDHDNISRWKRSLGTKVAILQKDGDEYARLKAKLDWLPNIDSSKEQIITKLHKGVHYYILIISDYDSINDGLLIIHDKEKIKMELEISELSD